jgi:hypothetical protein
MRLLEWQIVIIDFKKGKMVTFQREEQSQTLSIFPEI